MQSPTRKAAMIILMAWVLLGVYSITLTLRGGSAVGGVDFYSWQELWSYQGLHAAEKYRTDSIIESYAASEYSKSATARTDSLLPIPDLDLNRQGFITNAEALSVFFKALQGIPDSGKMRILHYGDSQIEGDRITSHIRTLFQSHFGGKALGYIPLEDPASAYAFTRKNSGNWKRHSVFQNKDMQQQYGLSGVVYRYAQKTLRDSLHPDTIHETVLQGNYAFSEFKFRAPVQCDNAILAYGRTTAECSVNMYQKDSLISKTILKGNQQWNTWKLPISKSTDQFRLEFQGAPSPALYGLYLDNERGIMVDNYAIRGHSGNGLLQIPDSLLQAQCKAQNVKLFIIQYGNNVIPFLDSIGECDYFERHYYLIFSKIRRLVPDASVLVIGVGDMLTQYHGNDITYPLLPAFRDAQKRAAERAGCAFWDLYEAMGGERALLAWTENKLASKDGHFAPEGQRLIASKLFEDIILAYKKQSYHP
jgi:lysophospholipase L1-like esterase